MDIPFKEPCGGCGEKLASRRCFNCHHEMGPPASPTKDTSDVVARLLTYVTAFKGAVDSGPAISFTPAAQRKLSHDAGEALALISSLVAERDNLEAWFDGLTPNEMHESITRLRDRALTAERLLAEARAALTRLADQADHCVLGVASRRNVEDAIHRLAVVSNEARASIGGGNG